MTDAERRHVRVVDGRAQWRCEHCQAWTSFDDELCTGCSMPRRQFVRHRGRIVRRHGLSRGLFAAVLVASALMPGGGHVALGRTTSGITRAVVFILWTITGTAWATRPEPAAGIVLLVGAGALWIASLVDTASMASDRAEVLGARGVLAIVVVATAGLFVTGAPVL